MNKIYEWDNRVLRTGAKNLDELNTLLNVNGHSCKIEFYGYFSNFNTVQAYYVTVNEFGDIISDKYKIQFNYKIER